MHHAPHLPVVLKLMHSSVHQAPGRSLALLRVHNTHGVLPAGSGKASAHLKRHRSLPAHGICGSFQCIKKVFFPKLPFLLEISTGNPGTILQLRNFLSGSLLCPFEESIQMGKLPLQLLWLSFPCPGKEMDSGRNEVCRTAAAQQFKNILFIHSKLIAAGKARENANPLFGMTGSKFSQLPELRWRFGCIAASFSTRIQYFVQLFLLFYNAGYQQLFRCDPGCHADFIFSEGTYFHALCHRRRFFHQKRIAFHGIAQMEAAACPRGRPCKTS